MLTSLQIVGIMLAAVVVLVIVDVLIAFHRLDPPFFEEEEDCDVETHEPEDY